MAFSTTIALLVGGFYRALIPVANLGVVVLYVALRLHFKSCGQHHLLVLEAAPFNVFETVFRGPRFRDRRTLDKLQING